MNNTDPLVLAYLAGVLDSDGSITIFRQITNPNYPDSFTFSEIVSVGQTTPEAVNLFAELWPGSRVIRKRHANWKPIYEWRICNRKAAQCIADLRPHLRVKARQADIILDLRRSKSLPRSETRTLHVGPKSLRLNPAIVLERIAMWRLIRSLNDSRVRVE